VGPLAGQNIGDLFAVAGKYTLRTNMWQLAMTMWVILTRWTAPNPPVPESIPLPDGRPSGKWTFGPYLRYIPRNPDELASRPRRLHPTVAGVDEELRELVADMLCDKPSDRPSPARIMAVLRRKILMEGEGADPDGEAWPWEEDDGEGDDASRAWVERVFGVPPPVRELRRNEIEKRDEVSKRGERFGVSVD
jgi:hypothetical protein